MVKNNRECYWCEHKWYSKVKPKTCPKCKTKYEKIMKNLDAKVAKKWEDAENF